MAQEILAEPAQVFGERQGPADYLYAIVEGLPRRWRPPADGVTAAPVVIRPLHGLVLITSQVDVVPRSTAKETARHDEVVSATLGAVAVLPLPFGTVLSAFEVEDWLAGHLGLIHASLPKLRRRVEMTIRLVSLSQGKGPRTSLRAVAERLVERVGVFDWCSRDGGADGPVSTLAFLVPRDGIGDFLARVAPVAARAGDVAVVPTGPWAPASFSPRLPEPGSAAGPERLARAG